jgi:hypothetical protein
VADRQALLEIKAGLLRSLAIVNKQLGVDDDRSKPLCLSDLQEPIHCYVVAGFLHKKTNSVTRKLESAGVPMAKVGRFKFCQKSDAKAIWPTIRKKIDDF